MNLLVYIQKNLVKGETNERVKMKSLLFHYGRGRHGMLMSSSSRTLAISKSSFINHMYSTENAGDTLHEIGDKARSTAAEFAWKAKDKKETVKDGAEEVLQVVKDATLQDTEADKEKFKEKVEKGNYDKIGRE